MNISNNHMQIKNNNMLLIFVNNNTFKKILMMVWGIFGILITDDQLFII